MAIKRQQKWRKSGVRSFVCSIRSGSRLLAVCRCVTLNLCYIQYRKCCNYGLWKKDVIVYTWLKYTN